MPRGARTGRAPGSGGASWAPGEVVMARVSRDGAAPYRVNRRSLRGGLAAPAREEHDRHDDREEEPGHGNNADDDEIWAV